LGFSPLLAILIVSSVATVVLVGCFYRLSCLDMDSRSAQTAVLLFLCSPFAFALFIPYPESLFLLCAVLCLFWGRQRRWWLSALAGALASLTRQQGIFLLFPIAWELWESCECDVRQVLLAWRDGVSLTLIPGGYLLWVVYRGLVLNDVVLNFRDLNTVVYSLLISPSASEVVPIQTFIWPWQALKMAFIHAWRQPDVDIVVNLVAGLYFLVLVAVAWKHLRISYRIYTVAIVVVSFAYHTGAMHPYMGLARHLFLAFPVWIGLSWPAKRRRGRQVLMVSGVLGMLFLLLLYTMEAWVP
jgi:hypothetical protein